MGKDIKELFGRTNKSLAKSSIGDITGSETPVESSRYIQEYIEEKLRFLPTVDFATASNFAFYGSAEQYATDTIQRVHNTYPYDGSLTEKMAWLNESNYYDLYMFENLYPRTCGYAVFSPNGWGTQAATVADAGLGATFVFGLSSNPEYIQLKAGPHPDPEAASKTLAQQFPTPWDGTANVWDNTSGVARVSNIVLDPEVGWTTEFWMKKNGSISGSSTTRFEHLFDVWNGETGTAEGSSYGRYSVMIDGTDVASDAMSVGVMSGSALLTTSTGFTASEILDDNWHHIAITLQSGSNPNWFELNSYLDGQHHTKRTSADQSNVVIGAITGSLIANIGAARIPAISQTGAAALTAGQKIDGYNKFSGSFDEFRFWKSPRTPKEISRFWFTQIAGGTNTDNNKFSGSAEPVDLGFYYKFNEGNTGYTNIDTTVLDYSGRISNGTWTGYIADASRIAGPTNSAMIESSASLAEFKDPIIYSDHPEVSGLLTDLQNKGKEWDVHNNSALYHTLPEWITSDDREMQGETLKKLIQIIGSYFDQLQMQVRFLPSINDKKYPLKELVVHNPNAPDYNMFGENTGKTRVHKFFNKPLPSAMNSVSDYGMITPELFAAVDSLAHFASRDEKREFETKLHDVKNNIFQNIYNNLEYIYRSKGTGKAFRNLLHCWGIDEDLVKINIYANDSTYKFDDSEYHSKTIRRNYVDFVSADRKQSTIYQTASADTGEMNYLDPLSTSGSITFEADVIFPYKHPRTSDYWYSYEYITSSIFGCHSVNDSDLTDYTWAAGSQASATLTFSDKPNEETIITLVDVDGTSRTFEVDNHNDGVVTGGAVALDPAANSGAGIATELASEINGEAALGITATNPSSGVVLLTMDIAGTAGNKAIVTTFNNVTGDTTAFTGGTDDPASFQVHALRNAASSNDVRFMLTSSNGFFPTLTSPLYKDVYDNNRWTFAVRLGTDDHRGGTKISGSLDDSYTLEFYGVNAALDVVQNEFHISGSVDAGHAAGNFMSKPKRVYAGAHRTNFTGSNVIQHTDIKLGSVSVWNDYLTNKEIKMHAYDPANSGREDPYRSAYLFEKSDSHDPNVDGIFIPKIKTQALNWQFIQNTGSSNGVVNTNHYGGSAWNSSFMIKDMTSGSDEKWEVPEEYQTLRPARGDWFLPNDTGSISTEYIHIANQNLPEIMAGSDTIKILAKDDNYFTRDSAPANSYFSIEKNMAQTISKEMLDMLGSAAALNSIIGAPVNRYRQEYKSLSRLREMFFRRVDSEIDFNRFIEFYKWIDHALSEMLMELVPASANFSDGIKTMIESHILERNKYWAKFPTMEMKAEPITGYIKGIKELTYDWKHGHAPLPDNEDQNCLWWSERSEASGSTSNNTTVDDQRNTIRRVTTSDITTNKIIATGEYTHPINYPNSGLTNAAQIALAQSGSALATRQEYKGSTYALRRFTKPYRMEIEESAQIHGGTNYHPNKRRELTKGWTTTVGSDLVGDYASTTPALTDNPSDCDDVLVPSKKEYHTFTWDTTTLSGGAGAFDYDRVRGTHYAPFNLVTTTNTSNASLAETGIDIVNLHTDAYGTSNEVPMQGPFTERHVGGMAHRHQDINDGTDTNHTRLENFRITNVFKDAMFALVPGNRTNASTKDNDNSFDRFYRDGTAKRPVNIKNIKTVGGSAHGNYDHIQQVLHTNVDDTASWFTKLHAMTGSSGIRTLEAGVSSLDGITDTADRPKLRYFAQTLLNSAEEHVPPLSYDDAGQQTAKHTIIERFSAPGGPDTAGDSGGGHGLAGPSTNYSPNNSLNYRNLAVRTPYNNLLAAHAAKYGAFSGSDYFPYESTTAITASFHKTPRNTDYRYTYTSTLTAYNSGSLAFDGLNDFYYNGQDLDFAANLWPQNFTLNAWVRHDDDGVNAIFNRSRKTSPYDDINIYTSAGRVYIKAAFGPSDAGANIWKTAETPIITGDWHSIAIVWDQEGLDAYAPPKIYVDGRKYTVVLDTADSGGSTEGLYPIWHYTQTNLYLLFGYGNYFHGNMQDISVWNRALSHSEIKDINHLPGYDSAGPGDLTTLDYVANDVNLLHHWWRFGPQGPPGEGFGGSTDVNDFAPRHTATTTYRLGNGYDATLDTVNYLAANYYGVQCTEVRDNWYVQHPIPSNDYGYAWITASANQAAGCDLVTTASFISASEFGSVNYAGSRYNWGLVSKGYGETPAYAAARTRPFIPVDFAGMNTQMYEPITSSTNTLGYPNYLVYSNPNSNLGGIQFVNYSNNSEHYLTSGGKDLDGDILITEGWFSASLQLASAGTADETYMAGFGITPVQQINALHHHRGGQYGYPTFKQIRTGEHPVARRHKKDNTLSIGDKATVATFMNQGSLIKSTGLKGTTFTNYTEPLVSTKYKPMVHRLDTATSDGSQTARPIVLKHTYANNLSMFANREITNKLDCTKTDRQMYHQITDAYINPEMDPSANPVKSFKSLIYGETVYPKEQYTFLATSRGRLNYDQTIVQKAEVRAGTETTWWRDRLEDRTRCDVETEVIYRHSGSVGSHLGYAINSMGYKVWKNYNLGSGSGDPRSLGNTVGGLGGGPSAYGRPNAGSPTAHHGGTRDLDTEYLHSGSVTWFLPSGALSSWPLDTGIDEPHIDDWAGDASPSGDQYGYNVGELYMDPIATLYASLSKAQLKEMFEGGNGTVLAQLNHFMAETGSNGDRLYKCPGTASVCFNHFALGGTTSQAASGTLQGANWNRRSHEPNQIMAWKANEYAGRNPFFDSYEDYSDDIRAIAKDYTVIPEFRMSEHIEHYLSSDNGFKAKNYKFLSLLGGTQSSSADNYDSDYNEAFWKEYCHSDFMKYFGGIQDDHTDIAGVTALSFRMSAVKKLLPYNGFYPVQRTVQLASLMSSSYGPYLSGSASASFGADSADNINSCHGGPYFAERMQSLLQPFYAPGIMFNTIKSGIAVDWACHTGSFPTVAANEGEVGTNSPWYWQHEHTLESDRYQMLNLSKAMHRCHVTEAPTFRMPFEAIINPDAYLPYSASADSVGDDKHTKGSLILVAPYYGSSSFHCNWQGQSKPYYSMAANNFFAEIPNFFLQKRTMNSFTSAREAEFKPMSSGSTYYMDVVLHKTHDYVAYENFGSVDGHHQLVTTRGWGYGPSYKTGYGVWDASDPSYAIFTPPYFYGAAKARIKFTPHEHMDMTECESFVFTLDDILAGASLETEYINDVLPSTPGPERWINEEITNGAWSNTIVAQNRMQVSSSVSLFGKTFQPAIEYDQNGNIISATENPQAGLGAWTIATKFECPSLNFYGKHGGAPDTDGEFPFVPDTPYELVEDDFSSVYSHSAYQSTYSTASVGALNQRVRGIYNGLGEIPTAGSGIFLSLKDSFPSTNYDPTCNDGMGSLLDVCGFRAEEKQIGTIAEQKIISEAVVAIPFIDIGGERKFFALGDTPSKSREIYLNALNGADGPGKSIRTMAQRMQRYIFPPHLDFKTDLMMEPFAMYIFEFSHKLTQKDLSYIWQGLMPDISVTAKKASTAITHACADNEFFRGKPIPEKTRWMVFKVKRRSRENYFALTADASDDSQFRFKQEGKPIHPPEYTYNWPYDFFSLVEVAKFDVKAGIGDGAIPIFPSPAFPLDLNPTSPAFGTVLAGGALAGATTERAVASAAAAADRAAQAASFANIDRNMFNLGSAVNNVANTIMVGISPTKLMNISDSVVAGGWAGGAAGGPIADLKTGLKNDALSKAAANLAPNTGAGTGTGFPPGGKI